MMRSILIYTPKVVFDFIVDVIYFLPWWYSRGLVRVLKKNWHFLRDKEQELAILIWIRNISKPLYDEYSWKNSVKSVILRLGQIIVRIFILIFWTLLSISGICLYILMPILVIWQIIYQII